MPCYRAVADGVIVSVRLTPKAAHDSLDGIGQLADGSEAAMARVRALPANGAANGALVALLAKALKIPRQSITIVGGAGARLKRVQIVGDAGSLSGKIEQWPRLS
jgi:uncharacterized protein YggU (UPF0235/DUF167 family)